MRWMIVGLFGLVIFSPMAGCGGDAADRVLVSGKVTYQGAPVAFGEIRFDPTNSAESQPSGAPIRDGQYKVIGKGGVPVGTHRVSITAFRANTRPQAESTTIPMSGGAAPIQYLPHKYNTQTELTVTLEPGENEKTLDYDLK